MAHMKQANRQLVNAFAITSAVIILVDLCSWSTQLLSHTTSCMIPRLAVRWQFLRGFFPPSFKLVMVDVLSQYSFGVLSTNHRTSKYLCTHSSHSKKVRHYHQLYFCRFFSGYFLLAAQNDDRYVSPHDNQIAMTFVIRIRQKRYIYVCT